MFKGIRRIVEYIVVNTKIMKANNVEFKRKNRIHTLRVNGKKVGVYYIPNLRVLGSLCAMTIYTGMGKHIIVVDDMYMQGSTALQKFALNHECGHVVHKDLSEGYMKKIFNMYLNIARGVVGNMVDSVMLNRMWEQEVAADKYAANVVGTETAIVALKELYSKTGYQTEIARRIKELGGTVNNPLDNLLKEWIGDTQSIHVDELFVD